MQQKNNETRAEGTILELISDLEQKAKNSKHIWFVPLDDDPTKRTKPFGETPPDNILKLCEAVKLMREALDFYAYNGPYNETKARAVLEKLEMLK